MNILVHMKRIGVYCGSSLGTNRAYENAAKELGRIMAQRGLDLVYGGAQIGIMGAIAESVLNDAGKVYGVIPGFLDKVEITHQGLTELHTTSDMPERKKKMYELSDGYIALPGGIGTLEELFEVYTWRQLNLHQKPIGILNTAGYYNHLLAHIEHAIKEDFMRIDHKDLFAVSDDPEELLQMMSNLTSDHIELKIER